MNFTTGDEVKMKNANTVCQDPPVYQPRSVQRNQVKIPDP